MNAAESLRFLTVPEAAELVRLSVPTIYRLCESGQIPSCRIGNAVRIPSRWKDKLLAACEGVTDSNTDKAGVV